MVDQAEVDRYARTMEGAAKKDFAKLFSQGANITLPKGKSIYSFGEDSPLKFQIPDKMAKRYNEAAEEFFKAQQRFNQKYGRKWDPRTEPIKLNWSKKQKKAWNDFAKIFGAEVERQGPFHANDIMDDFLVKNAVAVAAVASSKFGKVLSLAVAGGVLYGLLNRRKSHA